MEYRGFTEEELKWIRSFERVMAKAPNTLFYFNGSGTHMIYAKDEDNNRYMTEVGSVDDKASACSISSNIDSDGGDW